MHDSIRTPNDLPAQFQTAARRTDSLRQAIEALRAKHPELASLDLAFLAAQLILLKIFGTTWMERHLGENAIKPDFFRSSDAAVNDRAIGMVRAVFLAEMIFNLQDHEGVAKSVRMIENGEVQSGFTELEVAKLLKVNGHNFVFVEPRGAKGDDYDLELDIGGLTVCAEAKCKIEDTGQAVQTVVSTLKSARKQLPRDKPGIIIISIPPSWGGAFDDGARGKFLQEAVAAFFAQGTGRVVSVAAYTSLVAEHGFVVEPSTYTIEFINPRHRFRRDVEWRLFGEMPRLPDHWFSLILACR